MKTESYVRSLVNEKTNLSVYKVSNSSSKYKNKKVIQEYLKLI